MLMLSQLLLVSTGRPFRVLVNLREASEDCRSLGILLVLIPMVSLIRLMLLSAGSFSRF